ncbi:hypothetical protein DVK85_10055 [Flavobacterium arcticum]|uniref:Arm DNA-binding domain-containing protein n=1 Tax=Flavobacterium arcticum TaxID=1784713 RepID=A0A345HD98_9FLAO|nr:Arm DNA-binding domain-containing protein [Flavobacterium arcticum]AXG74558.1 hypothetical protein DVK85_10055 [Flavobacterium arcticum]KAF2512322.1 hypothetical protein E0W72_03610 [Flavobacterium arcticum]
MQNIVILDNHVPIHAPMKFTGKLTAKIVLRTDHQRVDNTYALYLQLFINKQRKCLPCNISVHEKDFDKDKQRVKRTCKNYKDYNLVLEKMLADINKIEVSYRLSNQVLTMDKLI